MSQISVALELSSLFCDHGFDKDNESEPYLWTIMFAFDGLGITQTGTSFAGGPRFFLSPGSHGNLGASITSGELLYIPQAVGRWNTTLQPIVVTNPITNNDIEVPAILGVIAILMEQNLTPDEDVEAGHQALNNLIMMQLQQFVSLLDLNLIVAKVTELLEGDSTLTEAQATQQAFNYFFMPYQENIETYASPVTFTSVFNSLGTGGLILSGISPDAFDGFLFQMFTQDKIELTSANGDVTGVHGLPPITFTNDLIDPAFPLGGSWAYDVNGQVFQRIQITFTPIPEGVPAGRMRVTGVNKLSYYGEGRQILQIGGVLPGGTYWWVSRGTAMTLIENGTNSFYVMGEDGSEADVVLSDALHLGHEYLTTTPDGSKEDNLLSLPQARLQIEHITESPLDLSPTVSLHANSSSARAHRAAVLSMRG